jgi:TPR repeat protein
MRVRSSTLLAAAAAFAVIDAVHADPFEEGALAYQRGDYIAAIDTWRPAAEAGDARAQFRLATIYDSGFGVARDMAEANRWFRLAAEQGMAEAQFYVGLSFYEGKGVGQDYFKAVDWFLLAANQGHAESLYLLGYMYENGWGVLQDFAEAGQWYERAAARGRFGGR